MSGQITHDVDELLGFMSGSASLTNSSHSSSSSDVQVITPKKQMIRPASIPPVMLRFKNNSRTISQAPLKTRIKLTFSKNKVMETAPVAAPLPPIDHIPLPDEDLMILARDTPIPPAIEYTAPTASPAPQEQRSSSPQAAPQEPQPAPQELQPAPQVQPEDVSFEAAVWDSHFHDALKSKCYRNEVKPVVSAALSKFPKQQFAERLSDFLESGPYHRDFVQLTCPFNCVNGIIGTCHACGEQRYMDSILSAKQIRYNSGGCRIPCPKGQRQNFQWLVCADCNPKVMALVRIYHFLHAVSRPKGFFGYQGFALLPNPEKIDFGSVEYTEIWKGYHRLSTLLSEVSK